MLTDPPAHHEHVFALYARGRQLVSLCDCGQVGRVSDDGVTALAALVLS
jgi:hypothetical protein